MVNFYKFIHGAVGIGQHCQTDIKVIDACLYRILNIKYFDYFLRSDIDNRIGIIVREDHMYIPSTIIRNHNAVNYLDLNYNLKNLNFLHSYEYNNNKQK